MEWDKFNERKQHRNMGLTVGKDTYWVPKSGLAEYSSVFSTMFYGGFQESMQDTIKLPDKKSEEILEMLRCLFPTNGTVKEIDYDNVVILMKLADEYQIDVLTRRCAKFLETIAEGNYKLKSVFILASTLGQKEIIRTCLPLIARFEMDELGPILNEAPEKIRLAVAYQKLGQMRFHNPASLVEHVCLHNFRHTECRLCGFKFFMDQAVYIPAELQVCNVCPTCRNKTIFNKNQAVAAQISCRCVDPKAAAELDAM